MPTFNPEILLTWRLESGFKIEAVCVLARCSYSTLRGLETGDRRHPSIDLLTRLADIYGRPVGELFTEPDPDERARELAAGAADPRIQAAIATLPPLTKEQKEELALLLRPEGGDRRSAGQAGR
jgi:transcriptional regulator with XRE-family HTH domain